MNVANLHRIQTKTQNVCEAGCLFAGAPCYNLHVKGWVDLLLGVIAATATALLLALIARDDIGMPASVVRQDALLAASVMAGVLAGVSWRKPKQKL
jgi:hypothetical protein